MFDLIPYSRRERGLVNDFNRFFGNAFLQDFSGVRGFKVDVQDAGDHFLLEADLPGAKKEDIKISLDGQLLTIRAEQNAEKTDEGKNYVYKERSYGSCSRSFDVSGIDTGAIKGKFKDGVLSLTLPKQDRKTEPEAIEIQIED
ncbi:MAG: Hsp20/alpha crystallin family protein [Saccharofermentanales bacterium]